MSTEKAEVSALTAALLECDVPASYRAAIVDAFCRERRARVRIAITDDAIYTCWQNRTTPRHLGMREHVIGFARDLLAAAPHN